MESESEESEEEEEANDREEAEELGVDQEEEDYYVWHSTGPGSSSDWKTQSSQTEEDSISEDELHEENIRYVWPSV